MTFIEVFTTNLQVILINIGFIGALVSALILLVESIVPIIPLCVFITIVFYTLGNFWGLLLCWVCTCIGSYISYTLCSGKLRNFITNKFINKLGNKNQNRINNIVNYISSLSTPSLTILIALPFTPAFAINIAAGLAGVEKRKFVTAMLIGKIFMVYFCGYIGTSLIESVSNPIILIKLGIMVLVAYIVSKISCRVLCFE